MRHGFTDELASHMYTRGNNPTVEILRRKVAALEGAEDCLMFGSGAGAVSAAVIASLRGGDHAICVARPYSWTRAVLRDLLGRFGVTTSFIDGTSIENFEQALTEKNAPHRARKPELDDVRAAGPRSGRGGSRKRAASARSATTATRRRSTSRRLRLASILSRIRRRNISTATATSSRARSAAVTR